jgi:transposase
MDVSKFEVPEHWPSDAHSFVREAVSEIQGLKAALKKMVVDFARLQESLEKAQGEIRELKAKLGTNSTNSHRPPSKDPPGAPPGGTKPSGGKPGAQKGHPGSGRSLFPAERVDITWDVFPERCRISGKALRREDLISLSFRRVHQVDLPEELRLLVAEFRLHTCLCPCGCGKSISAEMPAKAGKAAAGYRLKALMALLATRFRLSKTLIQELLVDVFGPDGTFSTGCISEAEEEMTDATREPYEEAKAVIQKEPAANVDETSWFLKHKIQWLWIAVSEALTVFSIDPNRSRAAFERFLGDFEGFIISDRFSAYARLAPEERQLCWAHLIRDFRKLVDRNVGGEKIGKRALDEIEVMFAIWHLYLDGDIGQAKLREEFVSIRARFGKLLKQGKESTDTKAASLCQNLTKLWPSLWNFLQRPDILQPTNNRAEQGLRASVIGRTLSLGSQSNRGLRFTERMLTIVTTLRRQGRKILDMRIGLPQETKQAGKLSPRQRLVEGLIRKCSSQADGEIFAYKSSYVGAEVPIERPNARSKAPPSMKRRLNRKANSSRYACRCLACTPP